MAVAAKKRGRPKGVKNAARQPLKNVPKEGLATVQEAMAYLRMSKTKVHALLSEVDEEGNPKEPAIKSKLLGRARRIRWAELRAYAGDN